MVNKLKQSGKTDPVKGRRNYLLELRHCVLSPDCFILFTLTKVIGRIFYILREKLFVMANELKQSGKKYPVKRCISSVLKCIYYMLSPDCFTSFAMTAVIGRIFYVLREKLCSVGGIDNKSKEKFCVMANEVRQSGKRYPVKRDVSNILKGEYYGSSPDCFISFAMTGVIGRIFYVLREKLCSVGGIANKSKERLCVMANEVRQSGKSYPVKRSVHNIFRKRHFVKSLDCFTSFAMTRVIGGIINISRERLYAV